MGRVDWRAGWSATAVLLTGLLAGLVPVCPALAQGRTPAPRRAELPQFAPNDYRDVFFDNLFAESGPLVGARPQSATVAAARPAAGGGAPAGAGGNAAGGGPVGKAGWAEVISPTTIEDEIKALNLKVQESVTTPPQFAGRGHKDAQKQFTMLALLFGIIGEYGEDVRWKEDAPVLRDRFARAASNTKAGGNIQVYNEAKLRKEDLQNVVRGSKLNEGGAELQAEWGAVVERSPLMRVLEERSVKFLQQATASEAAFKEEPEKVFHEAELVAAIAQVLKQEGMDDAGDEDYDGFLERMKKGALDAVSAVKLNNAEQARLAVGEITQACTTCHELYR